MGSGIDETVLSRGSFTSTELKRIWYNLPPKTVFYMAGGSYDGGLEMYEIFIHAESEDAAARYCAEHGIILDHGPVEIVAQKANSNLRLPHETYLVRCEDEEGCDTYEVVRAVWSLDAVKHVREQGSVPYYIEPGIADIKVIGRDDTGIIAMNVLKHLIRELV